MFEVRQKGAVRFVRKTESFDEAKAMAEASAKLRQAVFEIWEIKQVWTTQTLDEALKEGRC